MEVSSRQNGMRVTGDDEHGKKYLWSFAVKGNREMKKFLEFFFFFKTIEICRALPADDTTFMAESKEEL